MNRNFDEILKNLARIEIEFHHSLPDRLYRKKHFGTAGGILGDYIENLRKVMLLLCGPSISETCTTVEFPELIKLEDKKPLMTIGEFNSVHTVIKGVAVRLETEISRCLYNESDFPKISACKYLPKSDPSSPGYVRLKDLEHLRDDASQGLATIFAVRGILRQYRLAPRLGAPTEFKSFPLGKDPIEKLQVVFYRDRNDRFRIYSGDRIEERTPAMAGLGNSITGRAHMSWRIFRAIAGTGGKYSDFKKSHISELNRKLKRLFEVQDRLIICRGGHRYTPIFQCRISGYYNPVKSGSE